LEMVLKELHRDAKKPGRSREFESHVGGESAR